jgi:hypothetical protein
MVEDWVVRVILHLVDNKAKVERGRAKVCKDPVKNESLTIFPSPAGGPGAMVAWDYFLFLI